MGYSPLAGIGRCQTTQRHESIAESPGVVSHAALKAGGHVHGVLPRALVSRASEHTPSPGPSSGSGKLNGAGASQPESGQIIRSQEGIGKDLLEDDVDGRLTMQLTGSMHEVSVGPRWRQRGPADTIEEAQDGSVVDWRVRRPARRLRDVRGDDGNGYLEPGGS